MRKILIPKIWSQGTPLGSLGPLSLKDPDQRFSKHYFLLIWDPFDFPKLAALSAMAEKLKAIAAWCELGTQVFSISFKYPKKCQPPSPNVKAFRDRFYLRHNFICICVYFLFQMVEVAMKMNFKKRPCKSDRISPIILTRTSVGITGNALVT